jgi:hypothetical protein
MFASCFHVGLFVTAADRKIHSPHSHIDAFPEPKTLTYLKPLTCSFAAIRTAVFSSSRPAGLAERLQEQLPVRSEPRMSQFL